MKSISVINLGRTDYKECWDMQRRLVHARTAGDTGDLLLLTEHNHVYTIGTGGHDHHLLVDERELSAQGITVYHNDRGGDITYHGPGQLVGYPILDLHDHYLDLHRYLRDLEEVITQTLSRYGVMGERDARYTGVWVGGEKICAIGVKTVRWVTMHGFALNLNTDLSYFGVIIPCGIRGKGVTSLNRLLGRNVDMQDVADNLVEAFSRVFDRSTRKASIKELGATGNRVREEFVKLKG